MWTTISKFLLSIVMTIMSDKVLVSGAKSMINKAVISGADGIGIDNKNAKDLIRTITMSTLNTLDETIVEKANELLDVKGKL